MRLCPSQLQLSLNPPDDWSFEAAGVRGWLLWEVTRQRLKRRRWWIVCSRYGGGWVVIWGERCLCLWDAGVPKIARVFRTDLVTPLLFLMIKAEPEGRRSGGRHWYERISLTLILTVVSKHCCLESISKCTFECFINGVSLWTYLSVQAKHLDLDWYWKALFHNTTTHHHMHPWEYNVGFLSFFNFLFIKFQTYFLFLFQEALHSLEHKLMWTNSSAGLSLLPTFASHPLPCQLHIVLEDCENLSWCAALYRI